MKIISVVSALWLMLAGCAFAQPTPTGTNTSPSGTLAVGTTPITGGTPGDCLQVNGSVLGQGACAGGVTSIATGCQATGGTITTTGTISTQWVLSASSPVTSSPYTIVAADACNVLLLNSGSSVLTLPATATSGFGNGKSWTIDNQSGGQVTMNVTTNTLDGASSVVIPNGNAISFQSDGTNYHYISQVTGAATQAAGDSTTKIATDAFVTTAISNALAGVNPAVSVSAATIQASDTSGFTYSNGVAGIGATFTGTTNTAITIDGFTFTALGQRLLVKNDTQSPSGAFNGVYYVTQVQTGILPPILTRALDYDMPSDINSTGAIPVVNGTKNASTSWLLTSTVNTVGTDALTYTQFSLSPSQTPIAGVSSSDPTANNDNTQGYAIGSQWTNSSTGRVFVARSVATSAAVWENRDTQPAYFSTFWYSGDYHDSSPAAGSALVAGTVYALPIFIESRVTIALYGWRLSTGDAAGHVTIGIAPFDYTNNGRPGTWTGLTPSTTLTGTATASSVAPTSVPTVERGWYYLGWQTDSTTVRVVSIVSNTIGMSRVFGTTSLNNATVATQGVTGLSIAGSYGTFPNSGGAWTDVGVGTPRMVWQAQ